MVKWTDCFPEAWRAGMGSGKYARFAVYAVLAFPLKESAYMSMNGAVFGRMGEIIAESAEEFDGSVKKVSIDRDDGIVTIVVSLPPRISITHAVSVLKGRTSRMLRKEFPNMAEATNGADGDGKPGIWKRYYYAATVSPDDVTRICRDG